MLTLRDGAPTPAAETRTLSRAALAAAIRQVVDEEVARAIWRQQGRVD